MENHLVKMIDDNVVDYDDLSRIQEEVADKIIKNRYENFVLKFETQLGKTRTATMVLKRYVSPLIVCPAKLSKQWIDELKTQGVSSYEVITINKLNMKDNAQKYNWNLHDIIIIDEFQDMLKSKTMKYLQKKKSLHLIGLSATPAGNDNLNYYQIAKTFFHNQTFVKNLTKQSFAHKYLIVDEKEALKLSRLGVKTFLPPTVPNLWSDNFEKKLNNLISLKRDIKKDKVVVKFIDWYDNIKHKIFTRNDGLKFFPTSSGQASKLNFMRQLCVFDWKGSFETFKIKRLLKDFADELDELKSKKVLIVTKTPELAYAIAEYLQCHVVTGDTSKDDRFEFFKSSQLVATIQTVGVGISSLHHLERIVLIEPTKGQATIEQLKGRIMNNAKNDLTLEIWQ